jgi:hypothetical protein
MIGNPALGTKSTTPGVTFFSNFIPAAIGLAFIIGALFFFINIIIGAIQWISSGGDKQAVEGARGKITNAIIGVVILFSVYAILRLIAFFFKIEILTLDLAPLVIQ